MTAHRATLAALGVILTAVGLTLDTQDTAHAHPDHRPCVSMEEIHGTHLTPAITRQELEARWDVRHRWDLTHAVANNAPPHQFGVFQYKACGYHMTDVDGTTQGVYLVIVTQPLTNVPSGHWRDAKVVTVERLRYAPRSMANGRPRIAAPQ